ncbi:MAG: biotin--[acetyl-CoA-carboxylase] ligase [Bacteroidota bacterium]|nr:biotin--[acetyl-CoA-carboxylase] ligase [Bacteroidota bacterium]
MLLGIDKIVILETVDSTNNYAMAMIQKGEAIDGNAIFARQQTNGKGRRGKEWKSNKGDNIILSIMAQMQWLPVSKLFEPGVAVALGCHDFVSKHVALNTYIKWPNDIFINDSKAGGILIENVIKGTLWQWSVIGVGININQVIFEDYNISPISLKQITGNDYNVLQMAEELYTFVLKRLNDLKAGFFSKMLEEYNEKLYAKGRQTKFRKQNIVFETEIIGISPSGQLITRDSLERRFNFDEVEFLGIV